ncbi:MAG: hypothetical protein QF659_01080 [Dehalococcoidia bacterium]|nr:hypothetical protein [Dehalococcoidia bacterium]
MGTRIGWTGIAFPPGLVRSLPGKAMNLALPGVAAALALAMAALALAACGGGPEPSSSPDPRVGQDPDNPDRPAGEVRRQEKPAASSSSTAPAAGAPSTTPYATLYTAPSPTPRPEQQAGPEPTPNPDNSLWVQQRLDAVITLYDLTPAGAALLRSLDIRQMQGDPGFFGSYGFKEWAGVGEAKPTGVMHEIGHSYWGGFPVDGLPELGWDALPGESLSPAIQRYHADILTFMSQPPDGFEVFRQRLRNLPGLSAENPEPLLHNLEASLVYNTGGSLALTPPILRKYWSRFLNDGAFASWYDAVAWFQSLPDEDRAAASKYLGFEHLDLRGYSSLPAPADGAGPLQERKETLKREERQRLHDLAAQFDLLLGDPQKEENFQFWRGYLRDKVDLHRLHSEYLASLNLTRAADLAAALDFLTGLQGQSPVEQSRLLTEQFPRQPFLVNFLPALDNRTLLELFGSGVRLPEGATLQATASFVERLNRFAAAVNGILDAGRENPQRDTGELAAFLSAADFEQEEDLRLFFDLLREEDPATAGRLIQALDKTTIRRLMEPVPAQLRFSLTPDELLSKLDITAGAEVSALKRGISLLIEEPSGNFIIDEPFRYRMYEVIAARVQGQVQTRDMVQVLEETPFPLEGFIRRQPQAAVDLLGSDLDAALRLVRGGDHVLSPPARIIYRLVHADPVLAARLVQTLDAMGESELAVESLAYFAYDRSRAELMPGLSISLEQDGEFLRAIVERLGAGWLAQRLDETFTLFGGRAASGQAPDDFLSQYRATLEAAAATIPGDAVGSEVRRTIEQVTGDHAPGR